MMKTKLLALTLSLSIGLSGVAYAASTWNGFPTIAVFSGGKQLQGDTPAISIRGASYVPLRLLRSAGLTVTYDAKTKAVSVGVPQKETVKYALSPYVLDILSQSVYKVLGSTSDPTKMSQGSGFIVDGIMITNYHVAGDSAFARVEIDGKKQKVTDYAFTNKDADLMGFKVTGGKSLPISTELPKSGDIVYAIGYPGGELKVTEGEVLYISDLRGTKQIVHTASIEDGFSGGTLLNGKAEVIGIHRSSSVAGGDQYNWAIPAMYLHEELNK